MRFEVGKTYTFARTLFTPGRGRFGSLFIPWEDTLKDIQAMNLTCKEHHKVAGEFDPEDERKYDGFVFEDGEGGIWHNQYPTACYGQLDDTNDRVVFRHFETEELMKQDAAGEWIKRTDEEAVKKWEIYKSFFWEARLELATGRLGNLYRCINPRNKKQMLDTNKRAQLQTYLDALIEKIESTSQQKVIFEPMIHRFLDDRPAEMSDFVVARLSNDLPAMQLNQQYVPMGAILSREEFEDKIKFKTRFWRVALSVNPRLDLEPKLYEAERASALDETGEDDVLEPYQYFAFKYAGRHYDNASFLWYNVSRLNGTNLNYVFADKKAAEAYVAFAKNPANAHCFK